MAQFDPLGIGGQAVRGQVGALCYRRDAAGTVEVLLVTSRDTGRWIIPKGWPMPDRTPADAAAREAFEEAGVEGAFCDTPIGVYLYDKSLPGGAAVSCAVSVFPIRVTRLRTRFPEAAERQRCWLPQSEAAARVQEPDLAALLRGFAPPPDAAPDRTAGAGVD